MPFFIIKRKRKKGNYLKLKYFVITSPDWQCFKNGFRRKGDCSNDACMCTCACACAIVYLYWLLSRQYHHRHYHKLKKHCLVASILSILPSKVQVHDSTCDGINQASIINCDLYRPIKMYKQHKRVNKGQNKVLADMSISSKVSKLLHFCGCFFILWYSGWILCSFVAADIHTYGPNDFKGLLFSMLDFNFIFFLSFLSVLFLVLLCIFLI